MVAVLQSCVEMVAVLQSAVETVAVLQSSVEMVAVLQSSVERFAVLQLFVEASPPPHRVISHAVMTPGVRMLAAFALVATQLSDSAHRAMKPAAAAES